MIQRAAASSQRNSVTPGLHQRVVVEIIVSRDVAAVFQDLRSERVFVLRHVAEFFEQRQIAVRFHVAHRAGITVPVPGAAEVACILDHAYAFVSGFAQPRAHHQAAETATDYRKLDVVEHRIALEARLDIGIFDVMRELCLDLDVLRIAVRAQTFVALAEVFRFQAVGIEIDVADQCGDFRVHVHCSAHFSRGPGGIVRTLKRRTTSEGALSF